MEPVPRRNDAEIPQRSRRKRRKIIFSARLLLSPLLNPEIEYVVKINIGQQRTDASTLDRTYFALYSLPFSSTPALSISESNRTYAPVSYAMLDELTSHP